MNGDTNLLAHITEKKNRLDVVGIVVFGKNYLIWKLFIKIIKPIMFWKVWHLKSNNFFWNEFLRNELSIYFLRRNKLFVLLYWKIYLQSSLQASTTKFLNMRRPIYCNAVPGYNRYTVNTSLNTILRVVIAQSDAGSPLTLSLSILYQYNYWYLRPSSWKKNT